MSVCFIAPIVFLFNCNNGTAFLNDELRSFLGFLPGITKLVEVTGLIMLQKQKYWQNILMILLFANVSGSQSNYYVILLW
jgi:hypothetical protein